jgi:acid phosphatase
MGPDFGNYVRRHNPFSYFSDVQNDASQAANMVQSPQLATDISNSALPNYGFIVPDVTNDAHSCPAGLSTCTGDQQLAAADQWLSNNIKPLLASSAFQNSLLIIIFDESELIDFQNGGGHVPAVLIGPRVKAGYQSTTTYEHASTLRLMMEGLGVKDFPGAAATAADMGEFFK